MSIYIISIAIFYKINNKYLPIYKENFYLNRLHLHFFFLNNSYFKLVNRIYINNIFKINIYIVVIKLINIYHEHCAML